MTLLLSIKRLLHLDFAPRYATTNIASEVGR